MPRKPRKAKAEKTDTSTLNGESDMIRQHKMTASYAPGSEPMTADEACEYIPQWGSYMHNGDPGAIAYTAIPPERAAHRDDLVHYLHYFCRPRAMERGDGPDEGCEWNDVAMIDRACEYLDGLTYAPDINFIASSFGGGWALPLTPGAREYLERLLGEAPTPMLPVGGAAGWIIEPAELCQFREDVASGGMTILDA
jgi:hypothetical protein